MTFWPAMGLRSAKSTAESTNVTNFLMPSTGIILSSSRLVPPSKNVVVHSNLRGEENLFVKTLKCGGLMGKVEIIFPFSSLKMY